MVTIKKILIIALVVFQCFTLTGCNMKSLISVGTNTESYVLTEFNIVKPDTSTKVKDEIEEKDIGKNPNSLIENDGNSFVDDTDAEEETDEEDSSTSAPTTNSSKDNIQASFEDDTTTEEDEEDETTTEEDEEDETTTEEQAPVVEEDENGANSPSFVEGGVK